MNKENIEGKFDQVAGKIKQSVGEAVGNQKLANAGAAEQIKGVAKETWGKAKDTAGVVQDDKGARAEEKKQDLKVRRRGISSQPPRKGHHHCTKHQEFSQRKTRRHQARAPRLTTQKRYPPKARLQPAGFFLSPHHHISRTNPKKTTEIRHSG